MSAAKRPSRQYRFPARLRWATRTIDGQRVHVRKTVQPAELRGLVDPSPWEALGADGARGYGATPSEAINDLLDRGDTAA